VAEKVENSDAPKKSEIGVPTESVGKEKEAKKSTHHECIIEARGLEKHFKVGINDIQALRGVDVKVSATDFVVVFGPSGCGKSTLLNIMSGIDTPTKGEIIVRGKSIGKIDEDKRDKFTAQQMGIVHQHPSWIKSLKVFENVALPLIINGIDHQIAYKRAKNMLRELEIQQFSDQVPTQLSGGQQQKVAIARALVSNPWIIMADEPTGNLDSTSADEIMAVFHNLNKAFKRTIIIVTHNQAYWSIGTSKLEMKDGKIIKQTTNG